LVNKIVLLLLPNPVKVREDHEAPKVPKREAKRFQRMDPKSNITMRGNSIS
jgi:hypothetical protein